MSAALPDDRSSFEAAVRARLTRQIDGEETMFARAGALYVNPMIDALWWAYMLGQRDMGLALRAELDGQ